jgi:serine/threonine protein phosphatase PrpC
MSATTFNFIQGIRRAALRPRLGRARGFGLTDIGSVRERNEDAFILVPEHGLAVVADGVGGGIHGDLASRLVVSSISQRFEATEWGQTRAVTTPEHWLLDGVYDAHYELQSMNEGGHVATTVVAAAFVSGGVHIVHVGDSRAYRLRQGLLEPITKDHSLLNAYLDAGLLKGAQAKDFPHSHVLTQAVGSHVALEPSCRFHKHEKGDRYLLCTDGLTDLVSVAEITDILCSHRLMSAACVALRDAAHREGAHDNITTVICEPK